MSDDTTERLRRSNEVVIEAVLEQAGQDAQATMRGLFTDRVSIPVRIEGGTSTPPEPAPSAEPETGSAPDPWPRAGTAEPVTQRRPVAPVKRRSVSGR